MRLIGAGLFVFASLLAAVAVLGSLGLSEWVPAWLVGAFMSVFMLTMIGVALWLFNAKRLGAVGQTTLAEQISELEQQGLLETTAFEATRAFAVEEFEDEGSSYFLELADRRVLFLTGQYLYEYEPDTYEKQPRAFPCRKFSVRRHKTERYAVDIQCRGSVLEPEAVAPPFTEQYLDRDDRPGDGDVITTATYEAIKQELLGR